MRTPVHKHTWYRISKQQSSDSQSIDQWIDWINEPMNAYETPISSKASPVFRFRFFSSIFREHRITPTWNPSSHRLTANVSLYPVHFFFSVFSKTQDNANFETPRDAVNTSFPVRPGDIVILATDGLFDNMELENISSVRIKKTITSESRQNRVLVFVWAV